RHFGDLGDAQSDVSKLVAERGGYALMPEFGYQPVNRYLPPRPRRDASRANSHPQPAAEAIDTTQMSPLLRWVDRVLSR
ncbi:MAG TPA: hypothetical protein PLU65_10030, partial [Dokdonella sp.]|nr:hypothetical protein [Dokdonella sp.]